MEDYSAGAPNNGTRYFDTHSLVGCHNLAKLAHDRTFNVFLYIGAILAYCCVVIDFVIALSKTEYYQMIEPMTAGLLIGVLFCYDFLYLINIILLVNVQKSGTKRMQMMLLAVDILSFVPFEMIYFTIGGNDIRMFYGFRLRYTVRIMKLLFLSKSRPNYKFNSLPMIMKYVIITYIACLTLTCARVLNKCLSGDNMLDCTDLHLMDFATVFCMTNGLFTLCDLLLGASSVIHSDSRTQDLLNFTGGAVYGLAYIYVPIVQFMLYLSMVQVSSKIICTYIERLAIKYEFAILSDLVLKDLKEAKRKRSGNWSVNDHNFEEFVGKYLKTSWSHWESTSKRMDFQGYAVATMPDIVWTEIVLDVSWNMFKHSLLFKNEDVHFLRHLSLRTTYKVLTEGQPVIRKDAVKDEMLYLISGVIHVLSEDNVESPIISFSGGTVLGEMSLFMALPSSTTIICKTYCEFISLSRVEFIKCREFYPMVFEKMKVTAILRMSKARNYHDIGKDYYATGLVSMEKRAVSLRYIRKTLRRFIYGPSREQNVREMLTLDSIRENYEISNTILCADYLEMYVIADEREIGATEHFLTTGFFFKLNPNSSLVAIWNFVVYVLILITYVVYPIGAASASSGLYDAYMLLIAVVWFVDFCGFGFIGIQAKNKLRGDSDYIFNKHIESISFWLDFYSSLPIEYIFSILEGPLEENMFRLLQMNRLIKGYKLALFLNQKQYASSRALLIVEIVKMLVTGVCLVLFGTYIFYVNNYYDMVKKENFKEAGFFMHTCLLCQFFIGTELCEVHLPDHQNIFPLIILQYTGFLWKLFIVPHLAASFSLHYTTMIEFENLVDEIRKVCVLNEFDAGTTKKIMKYLYMHYQCGKGLHMLKLRSLVDFVGITLYKTQRAMMYHDLLKEQGLFKMLRYNMIRNICEIPKLIFIPKGEFVVFAGALPKEIYIIVEGTCAYVAEEGSEVKILKKISAGDSILVIEVLSRVKIIHNVITLTDCKLLSLQHNQLLRQFLKNPREYQTLRNVVSETINLDVLAAMQDTEIKLYREVTKDNQKSFRKFRRNTHEYMLPFGTRRNIFKKLLMPITIRPCGTFWVQWEVVNIIVSYFSALMSTVPMTIAKGWTSPFFWTFRVYDLIALTDIYLRHHVFFYNELNIEVTHPWSTAVHYWKTSFILDVFSFFPFELITVRVFGENRVVYLILSRINRYLRLYRIFGIQKYLNETYLSEVRSFLIAYYICMTLLLFQLGAYCVILTTCRCYEATNEIECEPGVRINFWYMHFAFVRRTFRNVFNMGLYEGQYENEMFWKYTIVNVCGYVTLHLISGMITAIGLSRNSYLTTFQIKMQRLISFMNMRKIDKNLRNELIKYYEYLWLLREGKTLQATFDTFNLGCYEEVMFSQMGASLQTSIIFASFPKVIIKDFLSSVGLHRDMFLIKGIIIKVNDVQDSIYILLKGTIDVLGPDYTKLQTLEEGSAFGCLDNVPYHRSTLTYVAKTHCELLSMASLKFYRIVRKYPRFYSHFLYLVRSSNIDYIVSYNKPLAEVVKKSVEIEKTQIAKLKTEQRRSKLNKCIRASLRVHKPNKKFDISMVVFCFISFIVEAFQKVVMTTNIIMIGVCYTLDILFLVRMYVSFSTSFENAYGLWVVKRKLIALRYVKNRFGFVFDLACSFPFEVLSLVAYGKPDWSVYWSFLRMNRLLKILIVFRFIKSFRNRLSINVYFVETSYILLLVISLQQMSMILIANCQWSEKDDSALSTYLSTFGVQTYFLSTALGYAYRGGNKTYNELLDALYVVLLFSTRFVMIYVFAEYVACYQVLNYGKFRYWGYLKALDSEMRNKHVSLPLITRVMQYFNRLADTGRNVQFPVFVREAPYYLREGLLNSMFGFHLRRHPIFKECHSDLIRQIAATFETIYFFPGDFIAFYGDMDRKMYFIHEGIVHCLLEDTIYYETIDRNFKAGDSFGFKQLFHKRIGHQYTYKVVTECTILVLKREEVIHLVDFFPASKHIIYNFHLFAKPNVNIDDAMK